MAKSENQNEFHTDRAHARQIFTISNEIHKTGWISTTSHAKSQNHGFSGFTDDETPISTNFQGRGRGIGRQIGRGSHTADDDATGKATDIKF